MTAKAQRNEAAMRCRNTETLRARLLCAVLELPVGTIALSGSLPGDVIVIMSSSHCSQEELNRISSLWPQQH